MDRVQSGLLKHIAANPFPISFENIRETVWGTYEKPVLQCGIHLMR